MINSLLVRPFGRAWSGIRLRLTRAGNFALKVVDLPLHGQVQVDKSLDFIGDNCLRTNLLTKLLLDKAIPGMIFEICSDNLSAIETIPYMMHNCECELLAMMNRSHCRVLYVRKCVPWSQGVASNRKAE